MPRISESRYRVDATWNDAPHLDEDQKRLMLASIPPWQRDARSKGIPSIGVGAIYPVSWEQISIRPFPIPAYWPRAYGMDVGWRTTAAIWGAWDDTTATLYLYAEHYGREMTPVANAAAIKARGDWIRGVIDPASTGASQYDGKTLIAEYEAQGLKLTLADNAVEAGLHACWTDFELGRIRAFSTLRGLEREYRQYHRDERGRIVKKDDHGLDAMRYLRMSGRPVARVKPVDRTIHGVSSIVDERAGY